MMASIHPTSTNGIPHLPENVLHPAQPSLSAYSLYEDVWIKAYCAHAQGGKHGDTCIGHADDALKAFKQRFPDLTRTV